MRIVSIGLLIVFGGLFAFNMVRSILVHRFIAHYQMPPATISATKVKTTTWHPWLSSVGDIVAVNGVTVSPEVAGAVLGIRFESGQIVKEGQALVQLDDAIDVENLHTAQAQFNLNQLTFARESHLFQTGAISKSDYDTAFAQLQQSQAAVNSALVSIGQKNIRAPFSGRLGIRQINLGQYLTPGAPVVTLQSLDPLYVN